MVGADDDGGLVEHAQRLEFAEKLSDMLIGVADADVVPVHHPPDIGEGLQGGRIARMLGGGAEEEGVPGRANSGLPAVAIQDLLRQPVVGQRAVGKGIAQLRRRPVGRVHIPVVDVQEPVVPCGVAP